MSDAKPVYEKLTQAFIIECLLPAFGQGFYIREADQKITAPTGRKHQEDWIYANRPADMQCILYSHVMFKYFKPLFSGPPAWCQSCYKTVCRPEKVTDLFKIMDVQQSEEHAAKAGIETRPYVAGLYGAYWYSRTRTDGKQMRKHVVRLVRRLNLPHLQVLLKRGCTEMERYFGDPEKWHVDGRQAEAERLVAEWVDVREDIRPAAPYIEDYAKKRMIEYAAAHGDLSYLELTAGRALHMMYQPVK